MIKKFLLPIITLIFILGFFVFQYFQNPEPIRASASDNVSGYAWSDNVGWISFNGTNYGVNITPTSGKLSGFAWSDNIGWISFNESGAGGTGAPPSNDPCSDTTCVAKASPSGQLGKGNVNILGWARALSNGGGWDGWIRFDHGQASSTYIDSTGNFHGYAWGSDVVGWISFDHGKPNPVILNLSGFNQPPNKPGIPVGYPANGVVENNCSIQALSIPTFNWTYSDPENDLQGGYQIQIDDEVSFSTSTLLLNETVGSASVSYTPTSAWINANLNWSVTYYWRAKVKDIPGNWSVWSDYKSFDVPNHAYPWIDFNWLPASPKAKELVQFSSASTTFYGVSGKSWAWDFGDSSATSTQNPSHSYLTSGNYLVKLGVCDNSNYCCTGVNAKQKSVQISLPLPEWKEVAPF